MLYRVVIGKGHTAKEALLFARINQIGYDEGIKQNTISKKTNVLEIPIEKVGYDSSKLIMAIHFAQAYYNYTRLNSKEKDTSGFTNSEYSYYCILIKKLGEDLFTKMMDIYNSKNSEDCLAVKCDMNIYKIMY